MEDVFVCRWCEERWGFHSVLSLALVCLVELIQEIICCLTVKETEFSQWSSWDGTLESQSSVRWLQALCSPEPAFLEGKASSFCPGQLCVFSLWLLTSRIQSKMCSEDCCVWCKLWLLEPSCFSAPCSQEQDSCHMYSPLVFLFLSFSRVFFT